jgi:ABC-type sugar transport system permease subunit
MFFSLWIVVPVAVLLVLFLLYATGLTFLMVFAEYFARGAASGGSFIDQPIRGEQLNFERALRRSRVAETTQPRGAALTRRTG